MVITDRNFDRRCRRRLEKHGLRMHKENGENGPFYYLYEIGGDDSRPDDIESYRWMSADDLLNYCGELEQQEAEEKERQKFYSR